LWTRPQPEPYPDGCQAEAESEGAPRSTGGTGDLVTDNSLEIETRSSAIAAFTLAQFAFWGLIESGLISTEKASEMLTQGIAAHSKGDLANQKAAEMLQTILDMVQRDQRPPAN
jgi:hypothetical protein